jgi:hypothetical protein
MTRLRSDELRRGKEGRRVITKTRRSENTKKNEGRSFLLTNVCFQMTSNE